MNNYNTNINMLYSNFNQHKNMPFSNTSHMKNVHHLLDIVNSLQKRSENEGVQSKYIINSIRNFSAQTAYQTLKDLVENGYLQKQVDGKYKYYILTDEGEKLLKSIKESNQRKIVEPLVNDIIDNLLKEYPDEFEDISYNAMKRFISKEINELETITIRKTLKNFVELSNEDEMSYVA